METVNILLDISSKKIKRIPRIHNASTYTTAICQLLIITKINIEKKNKCVFMERERDLLEERAHMVMEIEKSHDVLSAN